MRSRTEYLSHCFANNFLFSMPRSKDNILHTQLHLYVAVLEAVIWISLRSIYWAPIHRVHCARSKSEDSGWLSWGLIPWQGKQTQCPDDSTRGPGLHGRLASALGRCKIQRMAWPGWGWLRARREKVGETLHEGDKMGAKPRKSSGILSWDQYQKLKVPL